MLFPTHLVAAYVLGAERDLSIPWLLVGAAAPDVLDKPLAELGVVGTFHSVGHSGLVLLALLPLVRAGRAGPGVWLGWASHLALDAVHLVINGRPHNLRFLLWPVIELKDPFGLPPIQFALQYLWTPSFFLELGIWAVAGYVLVSRDRPWSRRAADLSDPE